jgi:hypothetical protein
MRTQVLFDLLCDLCHQPVRLDTATTDFQGRPIHSDCYAEVLAKEAIQVLHQKERAA